MQQPTLAFRDPSLQKDNRENGGAPQQLKRCWDCHGVIAAWFQPVYVSPQTAVDPSHSVLPFSSWGSAQLFSVKVIVLSHFVFELLVYSCSFKYISSIFSMKVSDILIILDLRPHTSTSGNCTPSVSCKLIWGETLDCMVGI